MSLLSLGRSKPDTPPPQLERRPMSSIEIAAREAFAPQTVPRDADPLEENVSLLADLAFVDGTTSIIRLARRLNGSFTSTASTPAYDVDVSVQSQAVNDDESTPEPEPQRLSEASPAPKSKRPSKPPPLPPPPPETPELRAAIDRAAQRRASLAMPIAAESTRP